MKYIESKENDNIKHILKLKNKKYVHLYGEYIVEGLRFVEEALKSNHEVLKIYISDEVYEKYSKLNFGEIDVNLVSKKIFPLICDTINSQGIIAILKKRVMKYTLNDGFYVLCDKVQDPGNMGTIIRTVHAANGLGVIITKGTVDLYSSKVLRASMGSIFNIDIVEDYELEFTKQLMQNGFKLIGTSLNAKSNFYNTSFKDNLILAVGNEGNGISKEIFDLCDMSINIPMNSNIDSLNVAVSSAIIVYEIARQKNYF